MCFVRTLLRAAEPGAILQLPRISLCLDSGSRNWGRLARAAGRGRRGGRPRNRGSRKYPLRQTAVPRVHRPLIAGTEFRLP